MNCSCPTQEVQKVSVLELSNLTSQYKYQMGIKNANDIESGNLAKTHGLVNISLTSVAITISIFAILVTIYIWRKNIKLDKNNEKLKEENESLKNQLSIEKLKGKFEIRKNKFLKTEMEKANLGLLKIIPKINSLKIK